MGVINEKSLIKEGYNVEVSTNDNLAFDISAENYMYYMQAVSSGFYSLKATKKGESGLPTGIKELKNDAVLGYNLEVTSDFTGSAEIEVKLQGQPEENSDPVTYATLTFKVTKK